jgi:hypothetical protein
VKRTEGEGLARDSAGRADDVGAAGSRVAGDAEGGTVGRGRGEAAGIAADVPAGVLDTVSAATPPVPARP